MYIIPYWTTPISSKEEINLDFTFLIFRNGRKIINGINNLAKATKLESIPTKFPLIKPKEKAQISETINR